MVSHFNSLFSITLSRLAEPVFREMISIMKAGVIRGRKAVGSAKHKSGKKPQKHIKVMLIISFYILLVSYRLCCFLEVDGLE